MLKFYFTLTILIRIVFVFQIDTYIIAFRRLCTLQYRNHSGSYCCIQRIILCAINERIQAWDFRIDTSSNIDIYLGVTVISGLVAGFDIGCVYGKCRGIVVQSDGWVGHIAHHTYRDVVAMRVTENISNRQGDHMISNSKCRRDNRTCSQMGTAFAPTVCESIPIRITRSRAIQLNLSFNYDAGFDLI